VNFLVVLVSILLLNGALIFIMTNAKLHCIFYTCLGLAFCLFAFTEESGAAAGRDLEDGHTFSVSLHLGQMMTIDGTVEETKRAYTRTPGAQEDYGHFLEKYDLSDFGLDKSHFLWGIGVEKQWKYFTLQLDGSYFNPSSSAKAVREPFAVGVEEVTYQGQKYNYMLIQQGESFDVELKGGIIELNGLFTPFHMNMGSAASMSPWVSLGLFSVLGHYDIDAGAPQGVTTYEFHPYDYVIGGKGKGWTGLVVPSIGIGGELKFNTGERHGKNMQLVIQGNFSLMEWKGSTEDFGIEARNAKDIDLDYDNYALKVMYEIPMENEKEFFFGLAYKHVYAYATIEAQHKSIEEQIRSQEKYDKVAEFEMSSVYALAGLSF